MIVHALYCKHTYPKNASILINPKCNNAYMQTIGDILKKARESLAMSQEDVAAKVRKITGDTFSRAALAQIESGATKNPKPRNLQAACDAMGIGFRSALNGELEWLNDYIGGQTIRPTLPTPIQPNAEYLGGFDLWDDNTPMADDEVALPFFREVELSAGAGRYEVVLNHGPKLRFAKASLRKSGVQPDNAVCVTAAGNSMEPVIPDGTTIGIDQGFTHIKNGEIYAIDHDGHLRIKLLYQMPGGVLRVRSFNSDEWPDEHYSGGDLAKIKVLGRVFWWSVLR